MKQIMYLKFTQEEMNEIPIDVPCPDCGKTMFWGDCCQKFHCDNSEGFLTGIVPTNQRQRPVLYNICPNYVG